MLWLIALIAAIIVAVWITAGLVHLALMLLVAGFVGWVASGIVAGDRGFGCLGSTLAGLVGGWVGVMLIGPVGPRIFGVRPIPALVGAIILVLVWGVLAKRSGNR